MEIIRRGGCHTIPRTVLFRLASRETTGGREPIGLHLLNRVVLGRARCERWPRPSLHPTQRTRIETHLSRMNSSWSSIQSSFSEHLSRPPTGVGCLYWDWNRYHSDWVTVLFDVDHRCSQRVLFRRIAFPESLQTRQWEPGMTCFHDRRRRWPARR